MAAIGQDIRYAVRTLLKQPGFTTAVIITLALGIGANTAIFSVVNGVLLQPLPYQDDSQLVLLRQEATANVAQNFSVQEILDYRAKSASLEEVVEYHSLNFTLLGRGDPERVRSGVVSWNFFQTLGLQPLLGRAFVPDDDVMGAEPVLVLSHRYWLNSFGGDSSVVGETVEMNDHVHTIVGVLPPVPHYPRENDVYMPTVACPFRSASGWIDNRSVRALTVFSRVRAGVTDAALQSDLASVARQMREDNPEHYLRHEGHTIVTTPLKEQLTQAARPTLFILMGTVGLVLLIATANVANLTLARLVRREREMAVRAALGAGRRRLARQLITESLILTLVGGALGLVVAAGGLDLLVGFTARFTTRAREVHIDGAVLFFTMLVSIATGVLFGSLPALPGRRNLGESLREAGSRTTAGSGKLRLRSALVVSQLAVSFMLLIGAGLVVRSLIKLQQVDPGFNVQNVLTMTVAVPFNSGIDAVPFLDALLERTRGQPGVQSAAITSTFPLSQNTPFNNAFDIVGRPVENPDDRPVANVRFVSADYFTTINQPLLMGRSFARTDRGGSQQVVVVNQSFVRAHFSGEEPIGQMIRPTFGGFEEPWMIVGVVGDVKQALDGAVQDEIYFPFLQTAFSAFSRLLVATSGNPMSLVRPVTDVVHSLAPEVPVADVLTLEEIRQNSLTSPRVTAMLIGSFAVLALIITTTGIAGVIGFSVSQRTNEIGVRMALGAHQGSVLMMILKQGMGLVVIGLLVGGAGALVLTRLLTGLLFEVNVTDPVTFVGVAVVLATIAAGATFLPARRATTIDPLVALRQN